jgi:hypothetical protein
MILPRLSEFARKYAVSLVVISGPLILLGWRLIIGQVLFWGTPSLQFVPWWMAAWKQIAQGSLPLWNPDVGLGAPLMANYQSAIFYPPNWILCGLAAVFGAPGVAWGYTFLALLHLVWAGLGMARLASRLGAGNLAQIVAGLAFCLSGYLVARLEFISMVWAAAWLPWIILYTDTVCAPLKAGGKEPLLRISIPLAGCVGLQLLAGHAQLSWYSLLLAGFWALVGGLRNRGSQFWRPLVRFTTSLGVGALLASIQLVPTAEYLLQSQRAGEFGYAEAVTYSFWPWRFITLFAPDFFGNPGQGDFWGYASYWEDAAYIGLLPLLLALATFVGVFRKVQEDRSEKPRRGTLRLIWGLIAAAFLLGLGQNTPVFPFLYRNVPTFAMFQAPARFLLWAVFGLSILAAVGVERWRCPQKRGLYWLRLGTAGAFAVTLGAGLGWMTLKGVNLTFIRATALAGLWALGTGGLTLLMPILEKRGLKWIWQGAVVVWVLADLLVASWNLNPMVSASFYGGSLPKITQLKKDLKGSAVYMSEAVEKRLKFRRFFRFQDYLAVEDWQNLRSVLMPNLNLLDGIPSLNNFDPIVPGRFARWIRLIEDASPAVRTELLGQSGVGAVVRVDVPQPGGVRFERIEAAPRYKIFNCPEWLGSGEKVLERLDAFTSDQPLFLLEGSPADTTCQTGAVGTVSVLSEKADEIHLSVEGASPGWLLASISAYPGWEALLDGQPVGIFHANYLFMGIELPQGKHELVLQYRPRSFYLGAMFSILVLFWYLVLLSGRMGFIRLRRQRARMLGH